MAGALRNDGELAPGELSEIEEEDGPKMPARSEVGHMSERERDFQQSAIMVCCTARTGNELKADMLSATSAANRSVKSPPCLRRDTNPR